MSVIFWRSVVVRKALAILVEKNREMRIGLACLVGFLAFWNQYIRLKWFHQYLSVHVFQTWVFCFHRTFWNRLDTAFNLRKANIGAFVGTRLVYVSKSPLWFRVAHVFPHLLLWTLQKVFEGGGGKIIITQRIRSNIYTRAGTI